MYPSHLKYSYVEVLYHSISECGYIFEKEPFKKKYLFLFLGALGLCCWTWTFSHCGEWGLLSNAVHGFLIVEASLVVEHRL